MPNPVRTLSTTAFLVIGISHPTFAQDLLSALPLEQDGSQFMRSSEGAYFVTRGIDVGSGYGFMITKYDALLQPLWSKEVLGTIVGGAYMARTNDGGVLCASSTSMTFHQDQNTTYQMSLIRFDADGDVVWSRTLDMHEVGGAENTVMPIPTNNTVFGWGNPISMSGDGEIFINMVNIFTNVRSLMKLNSDASPAWHVRTSGTCNRRLLGSPLPDEEGGCFFVGEAGYGPEHLCAGRILYDGTSVWVRGVDHDFSDFETAQAHFGPDGNVLIGGRDGSNAFLLNMGTDGVPSYLRLFAPLQPIDGYSVSGFEVAADGRMAYVGNGSLPGENGGTVITFVDAEGHLASAHMAGHFTQSTQDCSFRSTSSLSLADQFMVRGDYVREDTIFGFEFHQPFVHSSSFTDVVDCYFTPWDFVELASLPFDIGEDEAVSPLPVPAYSDQVLSITDLPLVTATSLCTSAGTIGQETAPMLNLGSNVLAHGEIFHVRSTIPGRIRISDMAGRSIGLHPLRAGEDLHVATASWKSGVYVVKFEDSTGRMSDRRKVVVR